MRGREGHLGYLTIGDPQDLTEQSRNGGRDDAADDERGEKCSGVCMLGH